MSSCNEISGFNNVGRFPGDDLHIGLEDAMPIRKADYVK